MVYKNIEIHNVSELIQNADGSVSFRRVPQKVQNAMEMNKEICECATGVELRFIMKSDVVKISLKKQMMRLVRLMYLEGIFLLHGMNLKK